MVYPRLFLFLLVLSLYPAIAAAQDTALPPSGKPIGTHEINLAGALISVKPPEVQVALAVAAEKTQLAQGAAPPAVGASLGEAAEAFGRITQDFGSVTAVAPPTMMLLNTVPGTPNIYADLSPDDAFKLLAATLSPAQWKMLTGSQGLGQADLATDTQRSLFLAQFPGGVLLVSPERSPISLPQADRASKDLSADLPRARLRLRREVLMMLPSPEHPNSFYNIFEPDDPARTRYQLQQGAPPKDSLYGVQTRLEAPNSPKTSDLDYDQAALRKTISLAGVKSVGNLVTRIGLECDLEIYADKRYEGRTVTIIGPQSAPARRLLQALAFCLTGTFRRVGPAYVLTNDLLGLGTRREIWAEFERQADDLRRKPLDAAGDALITAHSPDDVPTDADPLALSPAQVKQARQDNPDFEGNGPSSVQLPLSALTPAQREAAQQKLALFNEYRNHYTWLKEGETVMLEGKLELHSSLKLELIVPSLIEPVTMNNGPTQDELFRPSGEMQNKMREARRAAEAKPPSAPLPAPMKPAPSPPLAGLLKMIPHRAVLVRPQTTADVDTLVTSMKSVGLNELWLDVFSEGVCRVPMPDTGIALKGITPLPAGAGDMLAEAVKATRGSGIRVFPALDLLAWGAKTPGEMQERTILNETAAEADARRLAQENSGPRPTSSAQLAVSPFDPTVQHTLRSLVQSLAIRPGLAGIVWRETAPPGYEKAGEGQTQQEFGYAETARLAFLRRAHVDPFDVPLQNVGRADTLLPEFESGADGTALSKQWDTFRSESDVQFLRALAVAWAGGSARRPILVRQRRETWSDDWFGSWDGPAKPLPAHHSPWESEEAGPPYPEAADAQAKMTSQTALLRLSPWSGSNPEALAEELARSLVGKRWDGFVLDLTPDPRFGNPPNQAGENPLAGLTAKPAPAAK